jgi:hypothetical protein
MPKFKARIPHFGKLGEPRRLSEQEWHQLEIALGQPLTKNARRSVGFVIAMMIMIVPREKTAPSVGRVKGQVKSFQRRAEDLQRSIWYVDDPWPSSFGPSDVYSKPKKLTNLTLKSIEKRFFRLEKPIGKPSETTLILLAHALDAVIATCDLTVRNLLKKHIDDGFALTRFAIVIRDIFEFYGLPTSIRKDTDKMVHSKHRSPFIRFLHCLQTMLGFPLTSQDALAMRILRLQSKLKYRVR